MTAESDIVRVPITLGTYIALRRRAAGLTRRRLADLASDSAQMSDNLVEALRRIELGEQHPLQAMLPALLAPLIDLDPSAIQALTAFDTSDGPPDFEPFGGGPQICRTCGCTFTTPCNDLTGPCHWVDTDLCSACVPIRLRTDKIRAMRVHPTKQEDIHP